MEHQSIADNNSELFSVEGKVVLVTGGSRGIGLMIASAFIKNNATVYISSRKANVCDTVADELSKIGPGKCISIPSDLSSEDGCRFLLDEFGKYETRLDVLVNNAGAVWGAPLEDFPDSAFDKILNLNIKGVFHVTKFALPFLRQSASLDDPARVIIIGSINGMHPPVGETYSYSASKAGVHQLSRHLARRLAPEHISVNVIAPGPFPTKMMKGTLEAAGGLVEASVPLGNRLGRPNEVAGPAIMLASKAGAFITGATITTDGGLLLDAKV
eukprot:TRINITY_DN8466_c0_g1_i1.p1 TRINITY_DN8466_c0_g1~~TRINITY_DN8466_c0_g1_i1.p1  ORF type:complete len:271 (+),score=35.68 TRINITY_DN8466_c0_g1_i1:60-872(+)